MTTVFVNGSFDVLHPGHIRLLQWAKALGTILKVAIDSDRRIKEKKGQNRPFFEQSERTYMLQQLKSVSDVFVFDSDEELEDLIKNIQPDIMVVGSDWEGKKVIGSQYAKELKFFQRDERYSTTKILENKDK